MIYKQIIDGKECRYWFQPNPTDYRKCALRGKDDNCDEIKDCFIKELLEKLSRKEQECERLKEKLEKIRICVLTYDECPSLSCPDYDECRAKAIKFDEEILQIIEGKIK